MTKADILCELLDQRTVEVEGRIRVWQSKVLIDILPLVEAAKEFAEKNLIVNDAVFLNSIERTQGEKGTGAECLETVHQIADVLGVWIITEPINDRIALYFKLFGYNRIDESKLWYRRPSTF